MASRQFDGGMYPRPNKGKPGELHIVIGAAMMVIAPAFLLFQGEADKANEALEERGVVAAASVIAHDQRVERYTGYQGRPRRSTIYLMEVEYDFNATTPYSAWAADGNLQPSPYPAVTTSQIEVASRDQEAFPVGAETFIVRLPDDYTTLKLTAALERETSLAYRATMLLALAAAFIAGAALLAFGWRKRRAHG